MLVMPIPEVDKRPEHRGVLVLMTQCDSCLHYFSKVWPWEGRYNCKFCWRTLLGVEATPDDFVEFLLGGPHDASEPPLL